MHKVEERNGVDVMLCEDSCIAITLLVNEVATRIVYKVVAVALVFGVAAVVDTTSVSVRKKGVVAIACMNMFVDINIKGGRCGAASVCVTFLLSIIIALIVDGPFNIPVAPFTSGHITACLGLQSLVAVPSLL